MKPLQIWENKETGHRVEIINVDTTTLWNEDIQTYGGILTKDYDGCLVTWSPVFFEDIHMYIGQAKEVVLDD